MMELKDVIEILEKCERIKADRISSPLDDPEGIIYIQISDTLAKKMAETLKRELEH